MAQKPSHENERQPGFKQVPVKPSLQEQALRTKVKEIIGDDPNAIYKALDLSYTLRDALIIHSMLVGVVAGSCALFAIYGPICLVVSPLFAILGGVAFNWINVQVHEASHGLLLRRRKWNDVYCN